MTDPRNIAHDKKVQQEKAKHGVDIGAGTDAKPQPGKKPHQQHHASDDAVASADDGGGEVPQA